MMIRTPQEFERVARDWAVKYAGAPIRVGDDDDDVAVASRERHAGAQAEIDQAAEKRRM